MSNRKRWLYTMGGQPLPEPIEVSDDYRGELRTGGHRSEAEVYGNLQASDGADISTRKRHREYMKAKGVTLADDYRESWDTAAKRREQLFTEGPSDRSVRESVEKALYQLQNRKRR